MIKTMIVAAALAAICVAAPAAAQEPQPPTPAQTSRTASTTPVEARAFTAPTGLLFNTVRPERVQDFETVIAYLQAAFQKTTDPVLQAQARGWRIFKAAEPGPNGTVLYVFLLDPTVPGAEYGLGRILADVYRDPAQLAAIWRLYTGAVTSGGTLLNLKPIEPVPPPPLTAPREQAPAASPNRSTPPSTTPPAASPNRP